MPSSASEGRGPVRLAALLGIGLSVGVVATLASAPAAHAQETEPSPTVLFVVDTSGSMSGTPLEQAKEALRAGAAALEPEQAAGLRAYGGSCGDGGDLLVPVATDNIDELNAATEQLSAGGGTPTPDALRAAANDLPPTGDRTIVLISDGQSGCGDPCPVAEQIAQELGVGFRAHTVGFNAPDAAAAELTCIADATGGRYFTATNTEELSDAISTAVNEDENPSDSDVFAACTNVSSPKGLLTRAGRALRDLDFGELLDATSAAVGLRDAVETCTSPIRETVESLPENVPALLCYARNTFGFFGDRQAALEEIDACLNGGVAQSNASVSAQAMTGADERVEGQKASPAPSSARSEPKAGASTSDPGQSGLVSKVPSPESSAASLPVEEDKTATAPNSTSPVMAPPTPTPAPASSSAETEAAEAASTPTGSSPEHAVTPPSVSEPATPAEADVAAAETATALDGGDRSRLAEQCQQGDALLDHLEDRFPDRDFLRLEKVYQRHCGERIE